MQVTPTQPERADVLVVNASASRSIVASHIDVYLTVSSSSSVRSAEAARGLGEIKDLVTGLAPLGVDADQVTIESAEVAEGKGVFARGSTAKFAVVVRRAKADQLVGVLQLATEQSHVEHDWSSWRFDISDELQEELIAEASTRAKRRADAAARPLGVSVDGIVSSDVSVGDENMDMDAMPAGGAPMMARSKKVSSVHAATGIALVSRMRVAAHARVTFRVAKGAGAGA